MNIDHLLLPVPIGWNYVGKSILAVSASLDIFDYDVTQIIYKNKVAFIDLPTSTAWIVENERFARFQERLFRLLFEKL